MKSLKYLNKYFLKYKIRLSLGIVFVILSNIFAVYPAVLVREAVNYLEAEMKKGVAEDTLRQLMVFVFLIIGAAIISGFFMFLMRQTIIVMSRLIEYDLKNEIYNHYQKLDLAFYKRNNTGDLMNRISEDVSRVRMYIGPAIMYLANTAGTITTVIFFMTSVDAELSLYVLAPLPVLSLTIYYVSNVINKKSTQVQEQLSNLSTLSQESFSGIRIMKAYNREEHFRDHFEKESVQYKLNNLGLVRTEALFQPFMTLLMGLSTVITIYIGGMKVIQGGISIGSIPEFVFYVNKLVWPVTALGWVTSLIQRAAASQERINEFLHTPPSITRSNNNPTQIQGDIEFKNVSLVYKESGIKAVNNISFHVKAGGSLAITGKTGSGKSTIANLICRLYDADEGDVLIDGKNIQGLDVHSLRGQVGYVPQEVFLFSDTIANNIAFSVSGRNGEKENLQQEIEKASRDAVIYSSIMGFPKGFETVVGERGITLSGGQKQRISIARAIIRKPGILIFDDCLSAVDVETEEEILGNLQQIMKGKTSLIIGHRISSVKHADKILVLENGSVAEEGNHRELLQKNGLYASLYQMQLLEEEKKFIP